jgi:diguanylate cyclase (GGDEF)-like protein
MLMQRLPENMKFASRDRHMLAVLYFDIDRFKNINETKGFEIGNVILKEIARRVRSQLRETDAVYHIGGDEFIIIMNFVTTLRAVSLKADLLRQISSEPITAAGEEFYLSVSIGISIYPDDASDHQDLLNCANIALGHAKTEGKNNFQFFSENLNNKIKQKLTIENRLRKALDRNELEVFYQPRVKTKTGEISGMEALLRWNSPDLGSISPAVFIPLAEESDLINNIGEWTLFTACNHMVRWQKEVHNPIRLSVNFSVRQFHDPSILSMVKGVLDFTKYNPQNLEIEITESFFLEFQDEMLQILYRLKNLGIKISIDDFGTGYSSLNYLKRFPVDVIKIDRSFIKDIGKDGEAESIVSAILAMALQLGISVTAEGVETPEQLAFLQKHNCEEVQGYLFSSPLDFINFKKYIDSPLSSRSHPH